MVFKSRLIIILMLLSIEASATEQLAQATKKDIPVKSCDEVVSDYQNSCLKSCETYQGARKTQCNAACNDPDQLKLRKAQCEAGRKS